MVGEVILGKIASRIDCIGMGESAHLRSNVPETFRTACEARAQRALLLRQFDLLEVQLDRGGAADNDFVEFIELDAYERTAWRLLIEGSQGDPALEFNGPVVGAQAIYLDGLARLDERAGGDFASAPAAQRDQILGDTSDATVQAFVDIAYPDTLEAMYGPPEYGGNAGLVGWTSNDFDGDVHPRGYTDDQVVNADNPGVFDSLLPPSYGGGATDGARRSPSAPMPPAAPLAAAIASDQLAASMASANGSRRALRDALAPWLASGSMGGRHG